MYLNSLQPKYTEIEITAVQKKYPLSRQTCGSKDNVLLQITKNVSFAASLCCPN